jgi:DNA-binding MarR family transcriptional regulator
MSAQKTEFQLLDALWRFAASSTRQIDASCQEATECSLPQFLVLRALETLHDMEGATSVGDVARKVGCTKANAGQLVTKLEESGRIKKLTGGADARYVMLRLTAKGRGTYASSVDAIADDSKRIFKKLNAEEKQQLLGLLQKLTSPSP